MIIIDNTWEKVIHTNDMYYRLSPVQPKQDKLGRSKWKIYQFVKLSNARIIEVEIPVDIQINPSNRKEIERIALDNKWINRRAKLDDYLKNNPDCLTKHLFHSAVLIMEMSSIYPTYLRHPDGQICYERYMLSTDPGYRKGMSVIVDIDDETVYMKHFDNVVYNATNKGYTRLNEKEALKPVIRNRKLEEIFSENI